MSFISSITTAAKNAYQAIPTWAGIKENTVELKNALIEVPRKTKLAAAITTAGLVALNALNITQIALPVIICSAFSILCGERLPMLAPINMLPEKVVDWIAVWEVKALKGEIRGLSNERAAMLSNVFNGIVTGVMINAAWTMAKQVVVIGLLAYATSEVVSRIPRI